MRLFWDSFTGLLKDVPIFFITPDAERALGIEDIIPDYTIVTLFRSRLTEDLGRRGIRVYVIEDELGLNIAKEASLRGTQGILLIRQVQEFISNTSEGKTPCLSVFKNSEDIERFVRDKGWKLLAPRASVSSMFEQKISQFALLGDRVPFPSTVIGKLSFLSLPQLPIILQFNRGHSGTGTFRVSKKEDFQRLLERFPEREARLSSFIKGSTYTLNGLVLRSGKIACGSISLQLTGLPTATFNPYATVGNDFGVVKEDLTDKQAEEIRDVLEGVGGVLFSNGYTGMFGIDLVVEEDTGRIYFIEVNSRQVASISFEALLHRAIDTVPLCALYLFDVFNGELEDSEIMYPPIVYPKQAKQIIYRNSTERVLSRNEVGNREERGFLPSRLYNIKPGEEMYRIQEFQGFDGSRNTTFS